MSRVLKLTFFNFNVILISCLTTQGKGGCKRVKTKYIFCLYQLFLRNLLKVSHMLIFAQRFSPKFQSVQYQGVLFNKYVYSHFPSKSSLQEPRKPEITPNFTRLALHNKHLFGVFYLRGKITIVLRLALNQMSSCRTSQINQSINQSVDQSIIQSINQTV